MQGLFNRKVRILGGFLLAAGGILNMGLFLKVGSMFIVGITGLTDANALNIVMIVLLAIVLTYTLGNFARMYCDRAKGARWIDSVGIPIAAGLIVGEALFGVGNAVVKIVTPWFTGS